MFDPMTRRLIKEGMILLYRDRPDAAKFPVYYTPLTDNDPKDYGPVVKAMHDMEVIPWPDKECIVIGEDVACSAIPEQGISAVQIFVRGPTTTDWQSLARQRGLHDINAMELVTAYFASHKRGDNRVTTFKEELVLVHREQPEEFAECQQYVERRLDNIQKAVGELTDERRQWFRDHMSMTMPGKRFWSAHDVQNDHKMQIGYATDILTSISNLATPCHYLVKSNFPKGFGNGPIRRITAGKPIFSFIKYDRLYRCLKAFGHHEIDVDPHFRRGHVRHLWLQAGIDRFQLPDTVGARMRLVQERNVRRVYIPPTWVGLRQFGDSEVQHEIIVEPTEL